jgi:hypothetical protein
MKKKVSQGRKKVKKAVPNRKAKKTTKKLEGPKEYNIILFSHKDPMNVVLHFIGFIVMIYGAWFNNMLWILFGFVPMLVGHWWEKINRK